MWARINDGGHVYGNRARCNETCQPGWPNCASNQVHLPFTISRYLKSCRAEAPFGKKLLLCHWPGRQAFNMVNAKLASACLMLNSTLPRWLAVQSALATTGYLLLHGACCMNQSAVSLLSYSAIVITTCRRVAVASGCAAWMLVLGGLAVAQHASVGLQLLSWPLCVAAPTMKTIAALYNVIWLLDMHVIKMVDTWCTVPWQQSTHLTGAGLSAGKHYGRAACGSRGLLLNSPSSR
jgi:hypothetical protein